MKDHEIFKRINGAALRKFVGLSRTDELIKKITQTRFMSFEEKEKVIEFLNLLLQDIETIKNLLK